MPIYEFRCESCGARFDALTDAGTSTVECRNCGARGARRVYSPLSAPLRLVSTPREARKQERRNAQLRASAKARFKQQRARQRARAAGKRRGLPPAGGADG